MKTFLSLIFVAAMGLAQAETLWVDGVSQSGGWSDYNKVNPDDKGDGDNSLCWAAAASNVINWWQNRYVIPANAPTGEGIWSTFKSSVNADTGGNAIGAMQWWLTGWYSYDGSADAKQYACWGMGSTPITNETIHQTEHFEGYYRYLENNLISIYSNPWVDHLKRFMGYEDASAQVGDLKALHASVSTTLKDAIAGGAGVTVSLLGNLGGHAATLWGAEFSDDGMLTGLWLTDSDDNQYSQHQDVGLFYASLGKDPVTLTSTYTDGTKEEKDYYQLTTEHGWYGSDTYLSGFEFFYTSVSDTWGLVLVPEPATATLSLLALAGLVARRRR